MPALPYALAAFAAGAVLLQWQPALPSYAAWFSGALVAASGAWALRKAARVAPNAHLLAMALAVAAAGALGFAYAAWRAEGRLADALAPEWEGQDIALVGVIDGISEGIVARHSLHARRRAGRDPRRARAVAGLAVVVRAGAQGRHGR